MKNGVAPVSDELMGIDAVIEFFLNFLRAAVGSIGDLQPSCHV